MLIEEKQYFTVFDLPFVVNEKHNIPQLRLLALAAAYTLTLSRDSRTVKRMVDDYEELCRLLNDPQLVQQFETFYDDYARMIQQSDAPVLQAVNHYIKAHFDGLHFRLLGYWYANYSLALVEAKKDPELWANTLRLDTIDKVHQEMGFNTVQITQAVDPGMSRLQEAQHLMTRYRIEATDIYMYGSHYRRHMTKKERHTLMITFPLVIFGGFLLIALGITAINFLNTYVANLPAN